MKSKVSQLIPSIEFGPVTPYIPVLYRQPMVLQFSIPITTQAGTRIDFSVIAEKPDSKYRTAANILNLYKRNGAKTTTLNTIKKNIASGEILLLGKVVESSVIYNGTFAAEAKYFPGSIATNEESPAVEILRASIGGQVIGEYRIKIGWKDLVPIPVNAGLRVDAGADGKYVNKTVVPKLNEISKRIISARWKYPMVITGATYRWGGMYPPHLGHRAGYTLDIRPGSKDGNGTDVKKSNYDRTKTQELVDLIRTQKPEEILFADKTIKGVKENLSHIDHLHVTFNKVLEFENSLTGGLTLVSDPAYRSHFTANRRSVFGVELSLFREAMEILFDSSMYSYDKFGEKTQRTPRENKFAFEMIEKGRTAEASAVLYDLKIADGYRGPALQLCIVQNGAGAIAEARLLVRNSATAKVENIIPLRTAGMQ